MECSTFRERRETTSWRLNTILGSKKIKTLTLKIVLMQSKFSNHVILRLTTISRVRWLISRNKWRAVDSFSISFRRTSSSSATLASSTSSTSTARCSLGKKSRILSPNECSQSSFLIWGRRVSDCSLWGSLMRRSLIRCRMFCLPKRQLRLASPNKSYLQISRRFWVTVLPWGAF